MTDIQDAWTLEQFIEQAGGFINDDGSVRFASMEEVECMALRIAGNWQRHFDAQTADYERALALAKCHIASVNTELAETRLALHLATEALARVQVGPHDGARDTPEVH